MHLDLYRTPLAHAAYRVLKRLADLRIFDGLAVTMDTIEPSFLREARPGGQFLDRATLKRLARDPEIPLTERFIDEATANGDRCYGFVEGELLKNYGWYSIRSTPLTEFHGELTIHFDPSYAYMFNAFTHPTCRGQRLHAVGMARALEALTSEGRKGLLAYLEAPDFAAHESRARMGFRQFGRALLANVRGGIVAYSTPGCAPYEFKMLQTVERAPIIETPGFQAASFVDLRPLERNLN